MKPNGKMFAVRVVLFAVCAAGLFSGLAGAETVRGTFKLPTEAHWGRMVLAPGEYEFVVDTGSSTRILTVRSKDTGWTGMTLAAATYDVSGSSGASMTLARSGEGMYVQTLYLNDAGVALTFTAPKPAMTKLAKSTSPAMSAASGTN
jgi:hypothetical protein